MRQDYMIRIEPVSAGATHEGDEFRPGTTAYTMIPFGPNKLIVPASDAQIVAIQKYLQAVRNGVATGAVETAITALTV